MMKPQAQRWLIFIGLILLLAGAAVYFAFDPTSSSLFPKCSFKMLTGLDCPGCGTQRAIHAMLHGHVGKALRFNAMLFLVIPYCLLTAACWLWRDKPRMQRIGDALKSSAACWAWLVIIIGWWVGRNIFLQN